MVTALVGLSGRPSFEIFLTIFLVVIWKFSGYTVCVPALYIGIPFTRYSGQLLHPSFPLYTYLYVAGRMGVVAAHRT